MQRKKYIQKHDHRKKQKFHLPMSACLSYLIVTTLLLSSISLARYTASTTDGDGARVAKFEVWANPNENGNQINKIMLSTTTLDSETYTFTVKNTSEVVVKYKIIVTNVPAGIDVSINGSVFFTPDNERIVTFDSDDVLGINAAKNCTITFKAHDEYTAIKVYEKKMNVEVRFEQVD